jgi:hypothetical protein
MITCQCGAQWTGLGRAHCSACHLTFSTPGTFDRHRRNFSCLEPEGAGLVERAGIWGWAASRPDFLWQEKSEGLTVPGEGDAPGGAS